MRFICLKRTENNFCIWKGKFVGVMDIKGFFVIFTPKVLCFMNSIIYVSKRFLLCIAAYLFPSDLNPEILEGLLGSGLLLAFRVFKL